MSLRVRVYSLLTILVLAGTCFYVYKSKPAWFVSVAEAKGGSGKDKKSEKEATPVELALVKRSEIAAFLSATANLRALREVTVATQAEGIVKKVLAEEGDFVKEDQVLCTLDDAQVRIKLMLAEEKLAQAKLQKDKAGIRQSKALAQIGHTQVEFERYDKARKEGLVSDKDVATYKYKLDELTHDERAAVSENKEFQHKVAELEADIAQSKLDLARTEVRAPFAGFVTQRTVNTGQRLRPMDTLFNLASFSPLFADVHLSERDANSVQPGQVTTVRLGSDDTAFVNGRVERLSPIVDQASGTVKVTVTLEPKKGFRPGAFVRVEIRTDTKADAVVIPKRALIEEDGQNYVYVARDDSAKRIKVELGYQREGLVEVRSGLSPGQSVVVAGQGALKEGGKIKVLSRQTESLVKPSTGG